MHVQESIIIATVELALKLLVGAINIVLDLIRLLAVANMLAQLKGAITVFAETVLESSAKQTLIVLFKREWALV
jgi:hypothetical protein